MQRRHFFFPQARPLSPLHTSKLGAALYALGFAWAGLTLWRAIDAFPSVSTVYFTVAAVLGFLFFRLLLLILADR
jgi:apolipoprotein N-acyltransferase